MNTQETWDEWTPSRASVAQRRESMLSEIETLKGQHAEQKEKYRSTFDAAHGRQAARLKARISILEDQLEHFDRKHQAEEKQAGSDDAAKAKAAFKLGCTRFEKSLASLTREARKLTQAAEEYSRASGVSDSGLFPHKHLVLPVIAGRAHWVLDSAGLKFGPHRPHCEIPSLAEKWSDS
ncbi:MAG: hypothetical protein AAF394_09835 [Planctomycetota bacterium]